ncbi:MAG: VWA domain-containing protein [Anaerolineales bacterium]|nr:VWA domain-containing protein [Anaerolineales bacterium]
MWKNKIINLALVLVSLITLTGFSPNHQAEEANIRITQIDTSDFPRVTVYVTVTDENGEPMGVDPARIKLMENEGEIPLDQIEGIGQIIDPFTTLLVMDISGSMLYAGKLEAAKAAAKVFVEQLRPTDKIGLLAFHTEIFYVQPITTDRELILSAIDDLKADQDTVMYDALVEGASILSEVKGRKSIVAITDGLDTLSQSTPDTVLEQIGPAGLSISTIGLGDPDQDLGEYSAIDEDALKYLAEKAGGVYAYANDEESLSEIYQSYAIAFKSEYQLTYTSPSSLRDGVNRALSVSLADSATTIPGTEEEPIVYNPGGLVPEVSEPVPLLFFGLIMAGLFLLLLLPAVIKFVFKPFQKDSSQVKSAGKKKPRVKLKD